MLAMAQKPYLVVVIDDDDAIREYVRFILEKDGYRVLEAPDGKTGLSIALSTTPNLIITDLVMPDKEGIETIKELRKLHPHCRFIAMSGSINSDTYLAMALHLGAHSVLRKPFERTQLEDALRLAFEQNDNQRERETVSAASQRKVT